MQKNVSGQKVVVFAFNATTNLPVSGDAANLTCYVSKDYGSVTVLGDTSATEMDATNAKGYYLFDLTAGETNADTLLFSAKSSTANVVVVGVPATVFTTAPNFNVTSQVVRSATAQGGNATSITLDAGASATTDLYRGLLLLITAGTGAGQCRTIISYNGSTKIANVDRGWFTNPDNTSVFALLAADGASINSSLQVSTASPQTTIRSATAQTGSTASTIKLDAAASATDNLYVGNLIQLTAGTGLGQSRTIIAYNGTTKVATVDRNWVTTPDNTSGFSIIANLAPTTFSDQGVAQAGGATSITLASTASATGSVYVGSIVTILSGTGAGQTREITAYNGTTKVATVNSAWSVNPDSTSGYAVIPTSSGTGATPGTTDANVISWAGTAVGSLPANFSALAVTAAGGVTMADGVSHGGTPGSSTATLALKQLRVTNSTGTALLCESTGSSGNGAKFSGNGNQSGLNCLGGSNGAGMVCEGQGGNDGLFLGADGGGYGLEINSSNGDGVAITTGAANGQGVYISGGAVSGPAIHLEANGVGPTATAGYLSALFLETAGGDGITISPTGGHGINVTADGTGKHDIALTGSGDILGKLAANALDNVLVESSITAGAGLTNDTGTQLTAINLRQALALALSVLDGVLAGAGGTTITTKQAGKPAGNTRVTATVDASGNRSALTLKVPD